VQVAPAGLGSLVADFEVGAAAAVDPEATIVEAPGASMDARGAADLAGQTNIATGSDVTPVSFAIVGRACDDAGWRWPATADDEVRAAATVDPESAPIYTPGTALDAGRAADLADKANVVAAADVAVVSFAIVGGAGDLRWGAGSLTIPLLCGCG